jgi:hypothetical protein
MLSTITLVLLIVAIGLQIKINRKFQSQIDSSPTRGERGPQGSMGLMGPPGPQGSKGEQGLSGRELSTRTLIEANLGFR